MNSHVTPCTMFPSKGGSQEEGAGRVAHDATECGIIWAGIIYFIFFLAVIWNNVHSLKFNFMLGLSGSCF